MPSEPKPTAIPGPWVSETDVYEDGDGHGLAIIAVRSDVPPDCTPTRGMVAWVHSGLGACETDEQAIATARLISAAPDLLASLQEIVDEWGYPNTPKWHRARAAIAKATGSSNERKSETAAPSPKVGAMVDAIIAAGHTCQSVLARLDGRLANTPPGPGRDNLLAFRKQLVAKIKSNG